MAGLGWRDWLNGETVTEPNLQGFLQDQVVMVFDDSADRDATVSGAEGMVAYLKADKLLTWHDGTGWKFLWQMTNHPVAVLGHSASQNFTNANDTAIALNTEHVDTHNGHDNATNNTRYTSQLTGWYRCTMVLPFTNNTNNGKYECFFRRSDGQEYAGHGYSGDAAGFTIVVNATTSVYLTAGQYIEAYGYTATGSTRSSDPTYKNGVRVTYEWVRP